jgi:sialate O-acetylesterase
MTHSLSAAGMVLKLNCQAILLRSAIVALLLAPLSTLQAAELKLAALFSDHMVVQRDKPVPVWGWADPGEQVTVSFAGQKKTAVAGPDGKWMVCLDALKANAEGRELLVQSSAGDRQLKIRDVLVGEVWLGSGQSNMGMLVKEVRNAQEEAATAKLPLIRMFRVNNTIGKTSQAEVKGAWQIASPETVSNHSATLFFFGREIHRELQVPVGLINASVGGTPIESWMALEAQQSVPALKPLLNPALKKVAAFWSPEGQAAYQQAEKDHAEKVKVAHAQKQPLPLPPPFPLRGAPAVHFDAKIAPLIPCALRGVLWYQGEGNAKRGIAHRYQTQLELLVTDWRRRWGDELPFAWVQLANYKLSGYHKQTGSDDDWAVVRDSMRRSLRLPKTGMAVAIDIGDSDDIHPKNKQDVGRRLALWALGDVYAQKVAATSGPLLAGHETRGAEMVIRFTHAEGGLQAKGGDLKGFVVAGADRQWHPATARIKGDTVVLSSPNVKQPVAARYAWAADPECNLYNGAGLPASPFRTDDGMALSK